VARDLRNPGHFLGSALGVAFPRAAKAHLLSTDRICCDTWLN
jgi:hypothetical protein